jgi:hypothetical protein
MILKLKLMITNIKLISFVFLAVILGLSSCEKKEYSFGDLTAPSNLTLEATVVGTNTDNPDGNGTGRVFISLTANDKISYKVNFGDGDSLILHSDTLTYKYKTPGTNEYTLTVNAIGTGGTTSTISTKVKVFVAFKIPSYIVEALTANTSKVWMIDKNVAGHFGVGPTSSFFPDWWQIGANDAVKAAAYDDEVTFAKDELDNIHMTVDNKGQSFLTGAATSFYGFSGADGGYALVTGQTKKLGFMDATSASTSSNSTRIQFTVPGDGIIIFGTGGTTYEIISVSSTSLFVRNIGADGNAWYQRLVPRD